MTVIGWMRRRTVPLVVAAVLVVMALMPLLGAGVFTVTVLTDLLAYGLLAMSVSLVAGHAGLLTMAHAAYAGVGGYAAALLATSVTSDGLAQLGTAVGAGVLIAALTGWITARASKVYFLMLSLAIGELLYVVAVQWRPVTHGSDGLSAGTPLTFLGSGPILLSGYVYWIAMAVFLVFAGLVLLVIRSPFGKALRGIRDNEARMSSLGYPTAWYKYAAWVFSGGIAGAAGWLLIAQLPRFIAPDELSFYQAGLLLLAVVIGGSESMWGACLGAAILVVMNEVVSQRLGGNGPLVLGAIFVVAVYALPRGIAGIRIRRRVSRPSVGVDGTLAGPAASAPGSTAAKGSGVAKV